MPELTELNARKTGESNYKNVMRFGNEIPRRARNSKKTMVTKYKQTKILKLIEYAETIFRKVFTRLKLYKTFN